MHTLPIGLSSDTHSLAAYALVFLTQAVGMLIAILLLNRVSIEEFQAHAKDAIAAAIANDLD